MGTQPGKREVVGCRGAVHQAERPTRASEASDGLVPFVGLQAIQKGCSTHLKVVPNGEPLRLLGRE